MALSCIVSEILNVEKYRDLDIPVKSQLKSLYVLSFDRLGMVWYGMVWYGILEFNVPLDTV